MNRGTWEIYGSEMCCGSVSSMIVTRIWYEIVRKLRAEIDLGF